MCNIVLQLTEPNWNRHKGTKHLSKKDIIKANQLLVKKNVGNFDSFNSIMLLAGIKWHYITQFPTEIET